MLEESQFVLEANNGEAAMRSNPCINAIIFKGTLLHARGIRLKRKIKSAAFQNL